MTVDRRMHGDRTVGSVVAIAPKAKATTAKATKEPAKKAAKGGMSAEGRAKIADSQQKRWAKVKREKNKAAKAAKAALVVPAAE